MSDSDDSVVVSDSGSDFEEPTKKKAKSSPKKAPAPKKVAPVFKQNGGGSKSTPKKEKKTTPKKQKENVPNGGAEDDAMDVFFNIDKPHKRLSIEKIYQKKSQLEHILLRPDTYIGSIEYTEPEEMWVLDMEEKKIVQRKISYVPGLYKIFDEILVNAADNKQRDPKMKYIKVSINKAKNEISIMNDGKGIPVVEHKEEKMFVPEMIFGTLLTSSNYNDDERKVTGGRNGYGAKLCNIFSTKFTVETASKEYRKRFKQTWINNMTKDEEPEILPLLPGESEFTKITFQPDLAKFKMTELDDDIISVMARRAYDVAGTTGIKVYLNGEVVSCTGFQEYVQQYTKFNVDPSTDTPYPVAFETVNDRWQIAVTVSERGLQQVSFVNSIATTKGGRHVDYVLDNIISKIIDNVKAKVIGKDKDAKNTGFNLKPFQVKNYMWVFVNALIENPTFDSQTKETMTLHAKSFGSKCEPSEKFLQSTLKTGITDAVVSWVKFKEQEAADKKCSLKKSAKIKDFNELKLNNDLSELIEIFQNNKAIGEEEIEIGLEANIMSFDPAFVEHENNELAAKEKLIGNQKLLIDRYEDELSRERVDRIRLENKIKILSDENEKRIQEAMLLNQEALGQLRECERLREAAFAAMIKELKKALNKCNELESEKLALILKYQEL